MSLSTWVEVELRLWQYYKVIIQILVIISGGDGSGWVGGGPTKYFVTLNLSWGWVEAVTKIQISTDYSHLLHVSYCQEFGNKYQFSTKTGILYWFIITLWYSLSHWNRIKIVNQDILEFRILCSFNFIKIQLHLDSDPDLFEMFSRWRNFQIKLKTECEYMSAKMCLSM